MKKQISAIVLSLLVSLTAWAQVGVGTNDPQAILDVVSTNSGLIFPRVDEYIR